MPATSRAQFRFMQAVAHGGVKKAGLSADKAAEFVSGQSPKGLPERAPAPGETTGVGKTRHKRPVRYGGHS